MNIEVFFSASPVVQVHALAALGAVVLGLVQMLGVKGTSAHRILGAGFLLLLLVVVGTAVFIRKINDGAFSWIHLFVPLTTVFVVSGTIAARRGQVRNHRSAMRGLFFGALLIPGAFTFVPGRLMHAVVFG